MASAIPLSFKPPITVRACSGDRAQTKRTINNNNGSGGNWWAPIFGWGAEPDYITGGGSRSLAAAEEEEKPTAAAVSRRYAAFTEEKARELRLKTMEMETFHDAMYHSAIASRLASDRPRRNSSSPSSSSRS